MVKGKIALLTGATGGIGKEIAIRLAKMGINLAVCGRDLQKLNDIKKEAEKFGVRVEIFNGSFDDESYLTSLCTKVYEKFNGLDILINSAGLAINSTVEATKMEDFDKIMKLNVRVPFFLCKDSLKFLRKSDYATIINIASVVGHIGYVNQGAYSASKHALIGFTESLSKEVYKENIRVHLVTPGGVFTDMIKITRPDLTEDGMILPSDIADVIEFMLTHRTNAVIDEIRIHRVGKEPF